MAQLEKEVSTRLQANDIQISRLRGQIPSLLAIRGGRVVIDAAKQPEADRIEEQENILRLANVRMLKANNEIAEITKRDLDKPYTLASLLSQVKLYETEKVRLEQDNIGLQRGIDGKQAMGFSRGYNLIDRKGKFHEAADPIGDAKKRKAEAEKRIKELEKGIDKVSKVIKKIEPILQDALR